MRAEANCRDSNHDGGGGAQRYRIVRSPDKGKPRAEPCQQQREPGLVQSHDHRRQLHQPRQAGEQPKAVAAVITLLGPITLEKAEHLQPDTAVQPV